MVSAPLSGPIRIMLVEPETLLREGLRTILHGSQQFQVVAEAEDGRQCVHLAGREQPDVVLLSGDLALDILPEMLSSSSGSRVLVLTRVNDPEEHRKAMVLGAMGVIQKTSAVEILFKAIQKVHEGEIWYDRSKIGSVLTEILRTGKERESNPEIAKIGRLSQRERDVIGLICKGLRNKEIASKLFITDTTVRHHLTSVYEKLGVSTRLELIVYAVSNGLASLNGNHAANKNLA